MSKSIKTDIARPGGGYALLSVHQSQLVTRIAIQDRETGSFLSESGQWGKQRTYFPIESAGEGLVRLGPQIVDHISVDTAVAIFQNENEHFLNLIWPALRQSAGGRPNWTVGGGKEEPSRSSNLEKPAALPRREWSVPTCASLSSSEELSSPQELSPKRIRVGALLALLVAIILVYAVYNLSGWLGQLSHPQRNIVAQHSAPMAGKLTISAPDEITFTSYKGEIFNSKSSQINIAADGNGFNWITKAKPNWLDVSQQSGTLSDNNSTTLTGVRSRRRSASQAVDLPVNGGGTLGRLITRAGEHLSAIPKRYRLGRADRQHGECRAVILSTTPQRGLLLRCYGHRGSYLSLFHLSSCSGWSEGVSTCPSRSGGAA
jgi:hypothetical protein